MKYLGVNFGIYIGHCVPDFMDRHNRAIHGLMDGIMHNNAYQG